MFNLSVANSTSLPDLGGQHFQYLAQVILFCSVSIPSVISNMVLLIAICRDPVRNGVRESQMALLVVNLSVCDLLAGAVPGFGGIYYSISLLNGRVRDDLFEVRIVTSFGGVLTNVVSTCTISAMSFERFYAISSPIRHRARFHNTRIQVFVAFSWIYAFLFCILSLAFSRRVYVLLYCHVHVTVPLIFLPVVYWKTYAALRRHNQNDVGNFSAVEGNSKDSILRNRERKLLSAILLVLVLFYATFMPFYIALNMFAFRPSLMEKQSFSKFFLLSSSVLLVNCVFNPFIYSWRIPKYRRAFKAVFGRCGCTRRLNIVADQGILMDKRFQQVAGTDLVLPLAILVEPKP